MGACLFEDGLPHRQTHWGHLGVFMGAHMHMHSAQHSAESAWQSWVNHRPWPHDAHVRAVSVKRCTAIVPG